MTASANLHSPIQSYLEQLHAKFSELRDGALADYIPELTRADPNAFGICLATRDGHVYEVGRTQQPFTIQSISKPFTYGIALEERGLELVLERMSVEPSGDAFNSISLTAEGGRPFNPMINAGAIASTGLVRGTTAAQKAGRVLEVFSRYAGRTLDVDERVYESESETGHRNRAIGWMLRNSGVVDGDPTPTVEAYFRQCSINVNCRDLAVMGATLANDGENPLTGDRCLDSRYVSHVLSVMATCGMYDYAGQWIYWVGLPAKSGVGGGIVAVLPGRLGIGVFSPLLDARGNSVRGTAVCRELAEHFNLHLFRAPSPTTPVRQVYDGARVRSKRLRSAEAERVLAERGARTRVYVCQGEMNFPAAEIVLRQVIEAAATHDFVVLDFERVLGIDAGALRLFSDLVALLGRDGRCTPVFTPSRSIGRLRAFVEEQLGPDGLGGLVQFGSRDRALEWCEDQALARSGTSLAGSATATLADQELCLGLSAEELAQLAARVESARYPAGATIVRKGDPADRLFFLMRGEVSVTLAQPSGESIRLATFSPGMAFGEIALIDRSERTANVVADGEVECLSFGIDAFESLAPTHPELRARLLANLARLMSRRLRSANDEIQALSQ